MRRVKLDKIDRKIIRDLQGNGRMTNVDLAENAGISAPPCLRRVRALEENGYILSYHARVNPNMLGFGISVYAQIGLAIQSDAELNKFVEAVDGWEEVRECHMMSGDMDFMLKIVAEDWDAYQRFLTQKLTKAANIAHIKSSINIRTTKFLAGVPVDVD